jgi:hypothetical protein
MRRLLWKEWQERRLWIALWVLAGAVLTALGKGQGVCNTAWMDSNWVMLIPLTALLAGLGGYGSELHGGRAAFLYSRAVTWKQVLAAKLLLGLAAVIGSVIISAAAGRLLLPVEYHSLITLHSLAIGALTMAGFTAGGYLLGLAFSVILPGVAGSMLVAVSWFGLMPMLSLLEIKEPVFSIILPILAPLAAGLLLARFGVTLHGTARLRRFAFVVLVTLAAGVLLDFTPQAALLHKKLNALGNTPAEERFYNVNFSPDARYVLVGRIIDTELTPCLVRLSDGWFSFIDPSTEVIWLTNGMLATKLRQHTTGRQSAEEELLLWQWHGEEMLSNRIKYTGFFSKRYSAFSPDGRRLLLGGYDELKLVNLNTGQARTLAQADRTKLRILSRRSPGKQYGLQQCWWQANDEVGYLDPYTKERVIISLPSSAP